LQLLTNKYPVSLLILIFLSLYSCNHKPSKYPTKDVTDKSLWTDTASGAATYLKLKPTGTASMDLFYSRLATALIRQNKYELLQEHLSYYGKDRANDKTVIALTARVNGFTYNYKAKYDSARMFFEQAILLDKTLNNKQELAQSYLGMATNEVYWGNFEKSLAYHYLSLDLFEQDRDSSNITRAQVEIAIDYYYQKEYDKSASLLRSCQDYYKSHRNLKMVAEVESILSSCLYNLNDFTRSSAYALSSLNIRRQLGMPHDIAESLNNLSLSLMAQKQWTKAIGNLEEALILMEKAGDKRQLPIIRQNLANCLWENGQMQQAQATLKEAIAEAEQQGQKDAIANAYKKLSNINKKQGNAEAALYYYKRYKCWSDSIYNDEKAKAISTLYVKYETAKKEQHIRQLNTQQQLERTQKMVYLLTAVFIAVAAIAAILLLAGRNRKNKHLIKKVKSALEASEKELELHKEELDAFTKSILTKNKFIEALEIRLKENAAANLPDVCDQQDKQISALYQLKILTEDDWTEFKVRFDKVYPGYINKLRAQYPGLAPGEQRQFLLIKLNIETKECANMLGISIDSIKKNRYRLKKKFNLSEKENLDEFVRNFRS
jgi:tetratricopeptide (TPR) repeat protein